MEIIAKAVFVIAVICMAIKAIRTDINTIINGMPTIEIVKCEDCIRVKEIEEVRGYIREQAEEKHLIGRCRNFGVYVRADDYCSGGISRSKLEKAIAEQESEE